MKNSLKVILLTCTSLIAFDASAASKSRVELYAEELARKHTIAVTGLDPAVLSAMDAEILAHNVAVPAVPNDKVQVLTNVVNTYRTGLESISGGGPGAAADVSTRISAGVEAATAKLAAENAAKEDLLGKASAALKTPLGLTGAPSHAEIVTGIAALAADRDKQKAAAAGATGTSMDVLDAIANDLIHFAPGAAAPVTAGDKAKLVVEELQAVNAVLDDPAAKSVTPGTAAPLTLRDKANAVVIALHGAEKDKAAAEQVSHERAVLLNELRAERTTTTLDLLTKLGKVGIASPTGSRRPSMPDLGAMVGTLVDQTAAAQEAVDSVAKTHDLDPIPAGTIDVRAVALVARVAAAEKELAALRGIINPIFAGGDYAKYTLEAKAELLVKFRTDLKQVIDTAKPTIPGKTTLDKVKQLVDNHNVAASVTGGGAGGAGGK